MKGSEEWECFQAVFGVLISLFSHRVFNEEVPECTWLAEDIWTVRFMDSEGAIPNIRCTVYRLRGSVEYWSRHPYYDVLHIEVL